MSGASTTRARFQGGPAAEAEGENRRARAFRRAHGLALATLGCLTLAGLSLMLPSTLSYDPWAWLVWGREVAALSLDTRAGPSWKPLPVLFTTALSVFGEAAPALWLVVARAGALLGLVAAFRLGRRLAGPFGGVLAALFLALASGYLRGSALGYSEGLLVAFVLLGCERHLEGRRGEALALGFVAGLLRPEVWPFFGLYVLYVFVREPRRRPLAAALVALLPVLWLGPELWGSGDALRAASRAQDPTLLSPAFADRPWLAVLDRAGAMVSWPAKAGALAALVIALVGLAGATGRGAEQGVGPVARRRGGRWHIADVADRASARAVLAVAVGGVAWLALVAVMTELGYAGNSRYLAMPVALAATLGGVGVGWLARAAALALAGSPGPRSTSSGVVVRSDESARARPGTLVTVLGSAALVLACVPLVPGSLRELAGDAREVRDEARLNANLPVALARAGGRARVLACGTPYATALQVPTVAWYLRVPTGRVGIHPRGPGVLLRGPARLQPPDAPAPPPTVGGLRPVARVGGWTVSSSC